MVIAGRAVADRTDFGLGGIRRRQHRRWRGSDGSSRACCYCRTKSRVGQRSTAGKTSIDVHRPRRARCLRTIAAERLSGPHALDDARTVPALFHGDCDEQRRERCLCSKRSSLGRIIQLTDLNEFIASRWPMRRGPLGGAVSAFCELLPLLWFLEHKPTGSVVDKYESQHPRLVALAETLSRDARLDDLKAYPVDVALNQLWTGLAAIDAE